MPHALKVVHDHHGKSITSFVVPWKGRNGYTLRHAVKAPRDTALFDSPEAAIAALDTLWDNSGSRLTYEVINL